MIAIPPEHMEALERIAQSGGMTRPQVLRIAISRLMAEPPSEAEVIAADERRNVQDPTPEEIEAAKAEIQETWNPKERQARTLGVAGKRGGKITPERFPGWTPPSVKNHYR